ncbi:hypothetical protein B0H14DRAFT_3871546, partial [Mycena olivaceomarginata]
CPDSPPRSYTFPARSPAPFAARPPRSCSLHAPLRRSLSAPRARAPFAACLSRSVPAPFAARSPAPFGPRPPRSLPAALALDPCRLRARPSSLCTCLFPSRHSNTYTLVNAPSLSGTILYCNFVCKRAIIHF